jgi:hypothetical protein
VVTLCQSTFNISIFLLLVKNSVANESRDFCFKILKNLIKETDILSIKRTVHIEVVCEKYKCFLSCSSDSAGPVPKLGLVLVTKKVSVHSSGIEP